ncbi:hypothetical protein LguiA_031595 [Lonicera macranthoides]
MTVSNSHLDKLNKGKNSITRKKIYVEYRFLYKVGKKEGGKIRKMYKNGGKKKFGL